MGKGRVSTCGPSAEIGDASGWSLMFEMFSSSSALAPILPFAWQDLRLQKLQWGSQSHYFSAVSNRDAEAEVGAGATTATCSPNSTSISEGAEHSCGDVKHGGLGLLEGLGAFGAGDALWGWRMVVVVPVVVVVHDGGQGRMMSSMFRSKMVDKEE